VVRFELPDLSFFFVQLAPYLGRDFTVVRNAQMAALQLPKTGYAVAIDLGDIHSPVSSIHPRRKQEVGRRLAISALSVQYGRAVTATGPLFLSMVTDASGMVATVAHVPGTALSLHAVGTADCDQVGSRLCCGESPFQVLTLDGQWVRANFSLLADRAVLQLPKNVSIPVAARYAWEAWPQCSLYNGRGGPDDHAGIAATPWCWDGTKACAA